MNLHIEINEFNYIVDIESTFYHHVRFKYFNRDYDFIEKNDKLKPKTIKKYRCNILKMYGDYSVIILENGYITTCYFDELESLNYYESTF